MKPKYLWHGSQIKKNKLISKQAFSLKNKEERQIGIYVTNIKERSIVMAILHQKGVRGSRLNFPKGKVIGTIFNGWPKQKYFYLYKLSSKTFKQIDNWQWVSKESIKPLKVERLKTSDYIHMIRKATPREKKIWKEQLKKFRKKQKCQ
ncbi:hypothetical protein KAT80_01035 [Candidatus Pacearchaeota archaeon]|nr:hypothetical protein [Candidatus Pacearchaeota archaeon]